MRYIAIPTPTPPTPDSIFTWSAKARVQLHFKVADLAALVTKNNTEQHLTADRSPI